MALDAIQLGCGIEDMNCTSAVMFLFYAHPDGKQFNVMYGKSLIVTIHV